MENESVEAIVGIDLGTTYCAVATLQDGIITIMSNNEGQQTTPSVVFFPDEDCTLEKAIAGSNAETSFLGHPDRGVRFVKRLMGRKDPETGKKVTVRVGDKDYLPEEISAVILRKLLADAEEILFEGMEKVTDVVVTVPAYFGPEERNATEEAVRLAGARVRALVPEPIAAAIDYAKNQSTELAGRTVFVYDLGGGTFDATIMKIEQPVEDGPLAFWVLGKDGSIELGGSNWDQAIAEYVANDYAEQHDGSSPFEDIAAGDRLVMDCEKQKRVVSQKPEDYSVEIPCTYKGVPHTTSLTRAKFDELTRPLLNESLDKSSQLVERVFRAEKVAQRLAESMPEVRSDQAAWNRLITQCVAASETLWQQAQDGKPSPETTVRFNHDGEQQEKSLTPADFENAASEDDNPWSLIDELLLVGGSTKMKAVHEQLEELTGLRPRRHQGVDYNVARGAAVLAFTPEAWSDPEGLDTPLPPKPGEDPSTSPQQTLRDKLAVKRAGKLKPFQFVDTVIEGVGIEVHDSQSGVDKNFVLIPANTSVGEEYQESFGIARDGQTGVDIIIYKGNTEILGDVRRLGMVDISGLPSTTRAGEEVVVALMVDGNGLVKGSATHVMSKSKVAIEVKYDVAAG